MMLTSDKLEIDHRGRKCGMASYQPRCLPMLPSHISPTPTSQGVPSPHSICAAARGDGEFPFRIVHLSSSALCFELWESLFLKKTDQYTPDTHDYKKVFLEKFRMGLTRSEPSSTGRRFERKRLPSVVKKNCTSYMILNAHLIFGIQNAKKQTWEQNYGKSFSIMSACVIVMTLACRWNCLNRRLCFFCHKDSFTLVIEAFHDMTGGLPYEGKGPLLNAKLCEHFFSLDSCAQSVSSSYGIIYCTCRPIQYFDFDCSY